MALLTMPNSYISNYYCSYGALSLLRNKQTNTCDVALYAWNNFSLSSHLGLSQHLAKSSASPSNSSQFPHVMQQQSS